MKSSFTHIKCYSHTAAFALHAPGRYVLDEERATQLYSDYAIWMDLPTAPGDIFTYTGVCEQLQLSLADPLQGGPPGLARAAPGSPASAPLLQPAPGSWALPRRRFTQRFFVCGRSGKLHSRVALGLAGPFETFWAPIYNTVDVTLTLTPVEADAGADLVVCYPWADAGGRPLDLTKRDLPSPLWPPPRGGASWSPFSRSGRDYVRVAGPGVLVGCAYGADEEGVLQEEGFVYFAMARVR